MHPDFVGFRIWYADGSVKTSNDGTWEDAPSSEVQFVTFYEKRTYEIWKEDDWVTENYVIQLHSHDYYWLDAEGRPGQGPAEQVPDDIPRGALKTGSWMLEETGVAFWNLVSEAQEIRIAP
jgi:hypothetical protein